LTFFSFKTCFRVDNVASTKPLKTMMVRNKKANSCGIIVAKGKKRTNKQNNPQLFYGCYWVPKQNEAQ